ncbi:maltose O-acetyltransferase [Abditibacteriota bacterium]|nr:maltose O-acetyltransferase [Abditibacteriota bacterium]
MALAPEKTSALVEADSPEAKVELARFSVGDYSVGRPFWVRALWFLVNARVLQNPANPSSALKTLALRAFGAKIGRRVYLKPGINVKNPWLLEIGDDCWIGEGVWLDNLEPIRIGANVCISQSAYLCTGNHDWTDPAMSYKLGAIRIEDGAWICTRAMVMSGVTVGRNAIVGAGAVLASDAESGWIYAGNPAQQIKKRKMRKP